MKVKFKKLDQEEKKIWNDDYKAGVVAGKREAEEEKRLNQITIPGSAGHAWVAFNEGK